MFKIIGGDGKQYGPVTVDQVREWITSGRANSQTMAQREGDADWKPLAQFPEFVEAFSAGAKLPSPPPPTPASAPMFPESTANADQVAGAALARSVEINVGHCFGRAWDLLKSDFWPIVGISALILLVSSAAHGLLNGPLIGGLLWYFLRKIRRQPATINDAFAGFSGFATPFLQLFLGALISGVLAALGLLACLLPGIYLLVAWQLTLPLIQDRKLAFWDAMEVSRKVITADWWSAFVFALACVGVNFVGALCCGVGIFVTWPLTMLALAHLYEDLFGDAPAQLRG